MKSVPTFALLAHEDQMKIVADSWLPLLLLTLSQTLSVEDLTLLASTNNIDEEDLAELQHLKDIFTHLQAIKLDMVELTCLRSMILFQSNAQVQSSLVTYLNLRRPEANPLRLGSLLMQVSSLGTVSTGLVHKLFFNTIGKDVSMDNLVLDMFAKNCAV